MIVTEPCSENTRNHSSQLQSVIVMVLRCRKLAYDVFRLCKSWCKNSLISISCFALGKQDKEAAALMSALSENVKKHLGSSNYVQLPEVKWSDNDGTNEDSLGEYLVKFGELFEERVKMLIDRVSLYLPLCISYFSSYFFNNCTHD